VRASLVSAFGVRRSGDDGEPSRNNGLPFSSLNAGQIMVSVGLASIMNAMTPLFTAFVMASFREERLTTHRVIGVLLGVAGAAIIGLGVLFIDSRLPRRATGVAATVLNPRPRQR